MTDARIISDIEYQELKPYEQKRYTRVPFVYAHGQLEDDFGTDIIHVMLLGNRLCDGLLAYTAKHEPVRFHLYRHPRTFELTGIVTYSCKDRESYEYGKRIVEEKPMTF